MSKTSRKTPDPILAIHTPEVQAMVRIQLQEARDALLLAARVTLDSGLEMTHDLASMARFIEAMIEAVRIGGRPQN